MKYYMIDGQFYESDELYHHGIMGQKWGVRRYQNADGSLTSAGQKRYAKDEYKKAKRDARENYDKQIQKADSQYSKDMSEKNKALEKVNRTYDAKEQGTDAYYKKELDKHQQELNEHQQAADKAKKDMDFWRSDSGNKFYDDAVVKYNEALAKQDETNRIIADTQTRYEAFKIANQWARDNATIKVSELYNTSSQEASDRKQAAYTKAGEDYIASLKLARQTYKEAVKGIKKSK